MSPSYGQEHFHKETWWWWWRNYIHHDRSIHKIHVHANCWVLDFNSAVDICTVDGGVDSHVGGQAWLPFISLSGPTVQHPKVIGFDETSSRKNGCPIIQAVTNVETEQRPMLLRAKHLINNQPSKQTLLSTFQIWLIVYDISKDYLKDCNVKGT